MKCQDADEWMNRYLDGDLSETETKQLFKHLDSCPECAETFDMLKRISAGLDSLPDVKPRFSLVDSILPRLDELDLLDNQAEIKQAPNLSPAEMTPIAAEMESRTEAGKSEDNQKVRSLPIRRRQLWTRIAGGAAAAFILGFCIYQFQPKEVPNAEPAVENSSSAPVDQQQAGSSNVPSASDSGATLKVAPASDSANSGLASGTGSDLQVSSAPEQSDNSAAGMASSTPPGSEAAGSGAPNAGEPAVSQEPTVPRSSAGQDSSVSKGPAASASERSADSSAKPDVWSPAASTGITSSPSDSSAADGAASGSQDTMHSLVPPMGTDAKKSSEFLGIQAIVESDVWDSPNGKYVAKREDGHLNVYLVSAAGELTRIYDDPVVGEWLNGSAYWSEDGSLFMYSVIEGGQTVNSEVDAEQAAAMVKK